MVAFVLWFSDWLWVLYVFSHVYIFLSMCDDCDWGYFVVCYLCLFRIDNQSIFAIPKESATIAIFCNSSGTIAKNCNSFLQQLRLSNSFNSNNLDGSIQSIGCVKWSDLSQCHWFHRLHLYSFSSCSSAIIEQIFGRFGLIRITNSH